jgi:pheromone shutdown protein TraB
MADYAVFHNDDAEEVHLIVGAAHQPGVVYYLERYRDGRTVPESFELV